MFKQRLVQAGLALALLGLPPAFAQDFPARPIKLLVPYAAGGGTDAVARIVAQAVGERMGQAVIVENNGTGGGNLASQIVAAAPADGYTMLMANQGPMVVNPHLFKNLKVDPLQAFEPVTLLASVSLVLVVPQKSPFNSVAEFIDFAKKNPRKLSYGSAGNGSASHLAVMLMAQLGDLDVTHVPYRGAGPALNDLVSGQTDFMITSLPSVTGLISSGTVKALAVSPDKRITALPDVPTLMEAGIKDYATGAWYGFVVPKGTPQDVVEKLRAASIDAVSSPFVRERFASEGTDPIGSSGEDFRKMMIEESARWSDVVKKSNTVIN
ncbi:MULTISPECIES: tripartite tricarboxylate transporter substrate binding protein [unclassified Beijerinckia]|uniref:Bug family tripartite tricarboxylate transporter substrate binding protein n=1 Tax=unclassified Beijerinckia TaxID=2638183 RepID=UPI0008968B1C|nr:MULTISPECIES: tripartite tricarboxylate transporter substrate binding protein [unclassified Beijerinckia]MDH7794466.1 tripartite-type tricarboxylate transporter receptor subunit TctC [Beijerinckia sp. GAS462]SEB63253.1 Tripartite-type tricarboxylate transporter, receptor component TctC [Beijerinckia sp. 28-YEA-48]